MFAALLHFNDKEWLYEPEPLTIESGAVPDFLVRAFRDMYVLIEYKPTRTTEAYLDKLAANFHAWLELIWVSPVQLRLYCGNLWSGETELLSYCPHSQVWDALGDWHNSLVLPLFNKNARQFALNYRYDLASQG